LESSLKLNAIRIVHTVIWFFYLCILLVVFYFSIFAKINDIFWTAIAFILFEGIVLLVNDWKCPLVKLAKRYTQNPVAGFDIILPQWLVKHNTSFYKIYAIIFFISLILALVRITK